MLWVVAQTATEQRGWLSEHATLIVGVVGIIFSGFVGPTVTAKFTARRERAKDARAREVALRDDLRDLLDEAAKVLGGAVSMVRPLLDAQQKHQEPPKDAVDFLAAVFPLGQRLQLRLPAQHAVVVSFEQVRLKLVDLAEVTDSQQSFDAAIDAFERKREDFLKAAREAVHAPIPEDAD